MSDIVGPFSVVITSMSPLEAHLAYLHHLTNSGAAARMLIERFSMATAQAKEVGRMVSAHIAQGIEFHRQSVNAPNNVRPVMQYYCYLNFTVACILTYQPRGYQRYRHHGVEDKSYRLKQLDLGSVLVRVRSGALPLFHAIISEETLDKREFRLNELAAAIPYLSVELAEIFGMKTQRILVEERVDKRNGKYTSVVQFQCFDKSFQAVRLSQAKIERAMPALRSHYRCEDSSIDKRSYRSQTEWLSEERALKWHQNVCMKLVNFGGHRFTKGPPIGYDIRCEYAWSAVASKRLLPALTGALLLSFGLASIARYRPALGKNVEESALSMLLNVFIQESDGVVITTFRNLLFREEMCIQQAIGL